MTTGEAYERRHGHTILNAQRSVLYKLGPGSLAGGEGDGGFRI